ncbi:MAG: Na+/H+ antiporter subunit E [Alphaproteobacteria bacterium]|nr:Na+/H+ antiporter subunit E [Alphaproteobacteria bacterium]
MRNVSLALLLFLFWLALSGHYTGFFITLGLLTTLLCLFLARRMGTVDAEGVPIQLALGAVTYIPWLLWEILKSAWAVTRIIIDPSLPISPTMTRVKATQRTASGLNVYANSITLTPGTVTTGVTGNILTVHAIVSEGADDLEAGGMDARVSRFERGL